MGSRKLEAPKGHPDWIASVFAEANEICFLGTAIFVADDLALTCLHVLAHGFPQLVTNGIGEAGAIVLVAGSGTITSIPIPARLKKPGNNTFLNGSIIIPKQAYDQYPLQSIWPDNPELLQISREEWQKVLPWDMALLQLQGKAPAIAPGFLTGLSAADAWLKERKWKLSGWHEAGPHRGAGSLMAVETNVYFHQSERVVNNNACTFLGFRGLSRPGYSGGPIWLEKAGYGGALIGLASLGGLDGSILVGIASETILQFLEQAKVRKSHRVPVPYLQQTDFPAIGLVTRLTLGIVEKPLLRPLLWALALSILEIFALKWWLFGPGVLPNPPAIGLMVIGAFVWLAQATILRAIMAPAKKPTLSGPLKRKVRNRRPAGDGNSKKS